MKKFALIGAAGYVAPRHLRAIYETGNELVAALDPKDSVGILDSYFPNADFFVEFERFDRHLDKLRRTKPDDKVEYVSICSPNYLHDSHIRFALRSGAHAICEKPLVLNPWNIDALSEIEQSSNSRIYTILQLRHHPAIKEIKSRASNSEKKHDVDLTYITSRGHWYHVSWKGDQRKSGGIATNIGVHFFDMLYFVFGALQESKVHYHTDTRASGYLEYERARVRWFLSICREDIPKNSDRSTFRSIKIDGQEVEFSEGFTDLHTVSYQNILAGQGYGIEDTRVAIETVSHIRTAEPSDAGEDCHPLLHTVKAKS